MPNIFQKYQEQPWISWLIVALARQRKRQFWLREIHEIIKQAELGRTGTVPNHPEWEYRYHGMGLMLMGPNGEDIDVNFHDEKCETIDPYFFTNRLFGLETPEFPEARLRYWLPEVELVISLIRSLQGSLLEPEGSHVFQLSPTYKPDWQQLASNELNYNFLLKEIEGEESQLQKHKENFTKWLIELAEKEDVKISELRTALKCIPAEMRVKYCLPYLSRVDHKMAAAVKAFDLLDNPPVQPIVELLPLLNPKEHHPYLGHTICDFLLKRNIRKKECIQLLRGFSDVRVVKNFFGNPYDYDLMLLILTHSPKDGIDLIQRALTSSTPHSVNKAAALMAIIDEEWSNRELVKALSVEEKDKRKNSKRYIVAALMHSKDEKFLQIGMEHNAPVKPRAKDAVGYTRDEVIVKNMKANQVYHMKRAQSDLDQLNIEEIRELFE